MEETYQLTSALKHLPFGKYVTLLTDARFSGVSTGACVGHIGPEGLANGPIGKLRDGDVIDVRIDTVNLEGHLHFVGTKEQEVSPEEGEKKFCNAESKINKSCPHPSFRMIRACGPHCNQLAVEFGKVAFTMSSE